MICKRFYFENISSKSLYWHFIKKQLNISVVVCHHEVVLVFTGMHKTEQRSHQLLKGYVFFFFFLHSINDMLHKSPGCVKVPPLHLWRCRVLQILCSCFCSVTSLECTGALQGWVANTKQSASLTGHSQTRLKLERSVCEINSTDIRPFSQPLIPFRVTGVNPSWHWGEGGYALNEVTVHHQGMAREKHTLSHPHLQPI